MRIWIILAGLMGMEAVISGALAAHMDLTEEGRHLVEKAVQYEMWHALALLGVGILSTEKSRILLASGSLFLVGVCLFCGTLFIKGFWGITLFPMSAPIGGMCLILGWATLAFYGLRRGH